MAPSALTRRRFEAQIAYLRLEVAAVCAAAWRAVDEVLRVRGVGLALLDGGCGGEAGDEDGEDGGGEAHDY